MNDKHLDFTDIIGAVLYGNFHMPLPPTFQKNNSNAAGSKHTGEVKDNEGSGKRQRADKSDKPDKREKLTIIKNSNQHEAFKMRDNESWKKTFKSAHVSSRPTWDGEKSKKMCIRWHILGECFEQCDRKKSHVPGPDVPPGKVSEMCSFIAKCRDE